MKTLKSELTIIRNSIPDNSYCLYSNEFKELSLKYGREEVAKKCYEFDANSAILLHRLAISGNKKCEKYLKLSLKNNYDDSSVIRIGVGLISLTVEEGFEIIEQLLNNTYHTEFAVLIEDVYAYLLDVIHVSPKALKIVEDIENGKYGDTSFVKYYIEEKNRRLSERE